MTEGKSMNWIPSPLQVVLFFLTAINFAAWQPFVWWRGLGAVVMLACGISGWWMLRRRRKDAEGKSLGSVEGGN